MIRDTEFQRKRKTLAFLSEYQPHSNVVNDATAPAGVDRIKVCFDLQSVSFVKRVNPELDGLRVSETTDDDV